MRSRQPQPAAVERRGAKGKVLAKGLTCAKIDYERCARDERIKPPMPTYKYDATMMST
jgi:hypothetical protein